MDVLSKSDPLVVVYTRGFYVGEEFVMVNKTEVLK
jgi:hypothetical protein